MGWRWAVQPLINSRSESLDHRPLIQRIMVRNHIRFAPDKRRGALRVGAGHAPCHDDQWWRRWGEAGDAADRLPGLGGGLPRDRTGVHDDQVWRLFLGLRESSVTQHRRQFPTLSVIDTAAKHVDVKSFLAVR